MGSTNGRAPRVLCIGLNHKTAPLEIRERVAFPKDQLHEALLALKVNSSEGVILSTCNRTEVYTISQDIASSKESISEFISEFHSVPVEWLSVHTHLYADFDAVRHLFRVASGLDSLILGESQILGQVRDALTATASTGPPGVPISRLFHYALRTGRRVRDETDISANALSVSYAGVKLAQRTLGDLKNKTVLLVGAGEAGRLVAKALRTVGVGGLFITNRTFSRAEELVRELQGRAVSFDIALEVAKDCDIVISSTDAPGMLVTHSALADVIVARNGRPLFIFDLAVPRDIDPKVAMFPEVHLFNMDDLEAIAEENRIERQKSVTLAEGIVEEEVERFSNWWHSLEAVPLVKDLVGEAEAIRKSELEKAMRQMSGMTPQQENAIDRLTQSIVNRLLHKPIASLKKSKTSSRSQLGNSSVASNCPAEADSDHRE